MQVAILDYASIICAGKTFVLHLQAIIEEVTLKALICLVDKKTGEKSKTRPRFIKQDQIAIVRFQSDDVICMETFKDHPQLGRFTLRDEGRRNKFIFYYYYFGMSLSSTQQPLRKLGKFDSFVVMIR